MDGGPLLDRQELRRSVPALVAGFTISIVFFAVLSIVLTVVGSDGLGLTGDQASGWIALVYGLPSLISIPIVIRYRTPLLFTGNVFAAIFFATLGHRFSFSELAAAAILAGAILLATTLLGVTGRLARLIPAPIVQGLIAGAVLPFLVDIFSTVNTEGEGSVAVSVMVIGAVIAYLVAPSVFGPRLPPIVPAFLVGILVAAITDQLGPLPNLFALPTFELVRPTFSLAAVVTVTPVLLAIMAVQSNIPSVIYLRTQGFDPPERLVNVVSGLGTAAGSFLGPVPVSLALPPILVASGPSAGDRDIRYRAMYLPIAAGLSIALFAGTAAEVATVIPPVLLLTMAGLALVPALVAALKAIAAGPLVLGPLFAFAIALSTMSVFGLGAFFWSLVFGTLVSFVFEREGWKALHAVPAANDPEHVPAKDPPVLPPRS